MTQQNVELVIGRLVTDAEFRRRFERDPEAALNALVASGVNLNKVEVNELLTLDPEAFEVLAPTVGPRIQRAGFSPEPPEKEKGGSS